GGLFAAIRTPRPAILRRYIAHRPHRGKGSRVFAYRVRKIVILGLQRFDKRASDPYTPPPHAQVAELVDALASGASGLTAVKVRVLSWAPSALAQTNDAARREAASGCDAEISALSSRYAAGSGSEPWVCRSGPRSNTP